MRRCPSVVVGVDRRWRAGDSGTIAHPATRIDRTGPGDFARRTAHAEPNSPIASGSEGRRPERRDGKGWHLATIGRRAGRLRNSHDAYALTRRVRSHASSPLRPGPISNSTAFPSSSVPLLYSLLSGALTCRLIGTRIGPTARPRSADGNLRPTRAGGWPTELLQRLASAFRRS